MDWQIKLSIGAEATFKKLDKTVQIRLGKFFERIISQPNPRSLGKALQGTLGLYWCYRTGDYRIICEIHDNIFIIEVIRIDHRSDVYKNKK